MLIGYVGSSDSTSSTTNAYGSGPTNTPTPQTSNSQVSQEKYDNLARLVSQFAYQPIGASTPTLSAPPSSPTFGPNPKPSYDPNSPADPTSNNGRVAANAILKQEQFGLDPTYSPAGETQQVMQTIAKHQNDAAFLQSYFGALGVDRTASILRYMTSFGHIQSQGNLGGPAPNTVTPGQARQQWQLAANALSTLVQNGDFTQQDMNRLVGQFAKDQPQQNFMFASPGGLLSQASPQVNQMFFNSASAYALKNQNSTAGQATAAYAMQALSQTSNPLPELASLPSNQLSNLVKAAMKGEAAYRNPPTIDQFAKTGIFRAQDGQGAPLNGLTNLMFDAAYSNIGDQFSAAPLSTGQAQGLMTNLFQAAVETLQNDPAVKSFYTQNAPSQAVSMKDALAVEFQNGYDSIVNSPAYIYTGQNGNGTLSQAGLDGLREFFADAVFTPPPSNYASSVVQMMQQKFDSYITEGNNNPSAKPDFFGAVKVGEEAQTMAAGLHESFASILNGSQQADQNTQNLINSAITVLEAAGGAAGPEGGVGAAIVGEALKGLVPGPDPSTAVTAAATRLKTDGINVNQYTPGGLLSVQGQMKNQYFWSPFQQGVSTAQNSGD